MKKIYLLKRCLLYSLLLMVAFANCSKKTGISTPPVTDTPVVKINEEGLVTTIPSFPSADEPVTIIFDATKGNTALFNFGGDVYAHTGVITDQSTGSSDWKYVIGGSFNAPNPALKMTPLGDNKFKISFTPRSFYNVPAGEKILKIAILFRNGDGSIVTRNKDNSDIYIPLYEKGSIAVRFTSPQLEPTFSPTPSLNAQAVGNEITVSAKASKAGSLTLSLNGAPFASVANDSVITGKAKIITSGTQEIKVVAVEGGKTVESSFSFIVLGEAVTANLPSGAKDGVAFINGGTSAIVTLTAPGKENAVLIGDFSDWKVENKYFMKRTPDGKKWWIQVDGLDPAKEYAYQFIVDGRIKVADPYSEKVLDPNNDGFIPSSVYPNLKKYPTGKTTGIVSVMQGNAPTYNWKVSNFNRPEKKNLVIYELHLRDFIAAHNFNTLADTLDYLSNLGVNTIELLPVSEFEGNNSWGYNPSFYFAPDKYYGTKNALKSFIDGAHQRGIAVVMDMVLNHSFGQSPMVQLYFNASAGKPESSNPWFNVEPTHPYNVGYDFNHESPDTKYFVKNVIEFWITEYKLDGMRFDLSKGFTQKNTGTSDAAVGPWGQYDASRIAIWKEYNNFIKSVAPNNFYVILEHFAEAQEEKELANEGMMLWNNINHSMNQSTMGYVQESDFSWGFHTTHGFTQPYNLVTYMESHDEERMMFKNLQYGNSSGSYNVKDLATALKRQEMAAAFFFSIPGPKMMWQFGELGYDISINENGRTGEKPILWNYNTGPRRALYQTFSTLINMKIKNPVFTTTDFDYSLNNEVKYIKLKGADANVVVVGNFGVTAQPASVTFPAGGNWVDQLTGASINVPGGNYSATLAPGEYHLYSNVSLKK